MDFNDYRITTHGTSSESDWNGIQPAVSMSKEDPELKTKKRKTDEDGFPWWWIAFWIGVLMAIN